MVKYLISIFFLSFIFLGCSQKPDCKRFKNGTFIYPTRPGGISIRKGSIQESYKDGVFESLWDVRWISECEYDIICKKIINKKLPIKLGDRIKTVIVRTEENCYYSDLIFYNEDNPNGQKVKGGPFPLCFASY